MKKIEAIIRQEKLDIIIDKLEELGYSGITITEVQGHGRQKGITEQFRGKQYKLKFLPKIKIELVLRDNDVEKGIEAILNSAYTGEVGDGKIFIYDIKDVIRVRTKERGDSAV
jgi:nitrogen regulatory protein P-II 1